MICKSIVETMEKKRGNMMNSKELSYFGFSNHTLVIFVIICMAISGMWIGIAKRDNVDWKQGHDL
jgi:hypothetical protein